MKCTTKVGLKEANPNKATKVSNEEAGTKLLKEKTDTSMKTDRIKSDKVIKNPIIRIKLRPRQPKYSTHTHGRSGGGRELR